MCGIVGAVAERDVTKILLEGLKRLEYRGYDSAGVALVRHDKQLVRKRTVGKVAELVNALDESPVAGHCGIAHTRWATHGRPSQDNAHPQTSNGSIAIVHNGIIENYQKLKHSLLELNYQFESDTDTEVAAHLIHYCYIQTNDIIKAIHQAASQMEGAFAIGVLHSSQPEHLLAVRKGSPLVVGLGLNENFIASDELALQGFAQQIIYLEEGDIACVSREEVTLYDCDANVVERELKAVANIQNTAQRGEYRHFMHKEIHEQTQVLADAMEERLSEEGVYPLSFGRAAPDIFTKTRTIHLVACGTSYHAGLVAKYWLESMAGISTSVEVASEYRYRDVIVPEGALFVTISQSGETADTLAALRKAKSLNYLSTLAICNVSTSSLVRESDCVFLTRAGVEIGVASTKAFTTQLVALLLLTASLCPNKAICKQIVEQLRTLPGHCERLLQMDDTIAQVAQAFADKHHALFLGRGPLYPVALEGALKLKEISYIHAEAYPAGELKHGPLALIDGDMPVVVVAPNDRLLDKLKSNLQEVRARGGELFVFADHKSQLNEEDAPGLNVTLVDEVGDIIAPIAYTIPLQLLAYHVAVLKGTDVDQPRNLAKSVTVE